MENLFSRWEEVVGNKISNFVGDLIERNLYWSFFLLVMLNMIIWLVWLIPQLLGYLNSL